MNLHKYLFTNNDCYKAAQKITVKGVMWHSTGANNPNLRRYVQPNDGLLGTNSYGNHWNTARPDGYQVCVHAWIGRLADGGVATYQTLPWDINGWHCGGSANNSYIGFEICEDGLDDRAYFDAVYKEAVEFSAYLCKLHALNPLSGNTILDHSTGAKLGMASNHGDVLHWFGRYGITLERVRQDICDEMKKNIHQEADTMTKEDVKKIIAEYEAEKGKRPVSQWAKEAWEKAAAAGVVDGTMPRSPLTREQYAVTLHRLGQLGE